MSSREARGRALAQDPRIKRVDGPLWFIPSATKDGGYLVNVEAGRCGCADHTGQRVRCKHLIAAELVRDGQAPQVALTLPAAPAKARPMPRGDLTVEEQEHTRAALRFMRARLGSWDRLAKMLRVGVGPLKHIAKLPVSAGLAVRAARFAGVPVDDVLSGRFPVPGTCPHCGRGPEPSPSALPSP